MKETNRINLKMDIEKNIFEVNATKDLSTLELINILGLVMSEYNMVLMTQDDMESVDFLVGDKGAIIDRILEIGPIDIDLVEYKVNTFGTANHYVYEIDEQEGMSILDVACILSILGSYLGDTMLDAFAMDHRLKSLDKQEAIQEIGNLRKTMEINMHLMQIYGMIGCTYKDERIADEYYIDRIVDKVAITLEVAQDMLDNLESDMDDEDMLDIDRERYDLVEDMGKNKGKHRHHHHHDACCGHDHSEGHHHDGCCGHDHSEGHHHDGYCGHKHKN